MSSVSRKLSQLKENTVIRYEKNGETKEAINLGFNFVQEKDSNELIYLDDSISIQVVETFKEEKETETLEEIIEETQERLKEFEILYPDDEVLQDMKNMFSNLEKKAQKLYSSSDNHVESLFRELKMHQKKDKNKQYVRGLVIKEKEKPNQVINFPIVKPIIKNSVTNKDKSIQSTELIDRYEAVQNNSDERENSNYWYERYNSLIPISQSSSNDKGEEFTAINPIETIVDSSQLEEEIKIILPGVPRLFLNMSFHDKNDKRNIFTSKTINSCNCTSNKDEINKKLLQLKYKLPRTFPPQYISYESTVDKNLFLYPPESFKTDEYIVDINNNNLYTFDSPILENIIYENVKQQNSSEHKYTRLWSLKPNIPINSNLREVILKLNKKDDEKDNKNRLFKNRRLKREEMAIYFKNLCDSKLERNKYLNIDEFLHEMSLFKLNTFNPILWKNLKKHFAKNIKRINDSQNKFKIEDDMEKADKINRGLNEMLLFFREYSEKCKESITCPDTELCFSNIDKNNIIPPQKLCSLGVMLPNIDNSFLSLFFKINDKYLSKYISNQAIIPEIVEHFSVKNTLYFNKYLNHLGNSNLNGIDIQNILSFIQITNNEYVMEIYLKLLDVIMKKNSEILNDPEETSLNFEELVQIMYKRINKMTSNQPLMENEINISVKEITEIEIKKFIFREILQLKNVNKKEYEYFIENYISNFCVKSGSNWVLKENDTTFIACQHTIDEFKLDENTYQQKWAIIEDNVYICKNCCEKLDIEMKTYTYEEIEEDKTKVISSQTEKKTYRYSRNEQIIRKYLQLKIIQITKLQIPEKAILQIVQRTISPLSKFFISKQFIKYVKENPDFSLDKFIIETKKQQRILKNKIENNKKKNKILEKKLEDINKSLRYCDNIKLRIIVETYIVMLLSIPVIRYNYGKNSTSMYVFQDYEQMIQKNEISPILLKLCSYLNIEISKIESILLIINSFPNINTKLSIKREHIISTNRLQNKSLLFIRPRHTLTDLNEEGYNNVLKMFKKTNLRESSIFHLPLNPILYSYKPFHFNKRKNMFIESFIQDSVEKTTKKQHFQNPEFGHSIIKEKEFRNNESILNINEENYIDIFQNLKLNYIENGENAGKRRTFTQILLSKTIIENDLYKKFNFNIDFKDSKYFNFKKDIISNQLYSEIKSQNHNNASISDVQNFEKLIWRINKIIIRTHKTEQFSDIFNKLEIKTLNSSINIFEDITTTGENDNEIIKNLINFIKQNTFIEIQDTNDILNELFIKLLPKTNIDSLKRIATFSETSRLELLLKIQYYIKFMISKKNIDLQINDTENKFLSYLADKISKVKLNNDLQFNNYLIEGKKELIPVLNVIYLFSLVKLMSISKNIDFSRNIDLFVKDILQMNDINNKSIEQTINNIKKKKNIQRQKSASKMSDEEKALHEHHRSLGLGNVFNAMGNDEIDLNEEIPEESEEKLIDEDYLDSNLDK